MPDMPDELAMSSSDTESDYHQAWSAKRKRHFQTDAQWMKLFQSFSDEAEASTAGSACLWQCETSEEESEAETPRSFSFCPSMDRRRSTAFILPDDGAEEADTEDNSEDVDEESEVDTGYRQSASVPRLPPRVRRPKCSTQERALMILDQYGVLGAKHWRLQRRKPDVETESDAPQRTLHKVELEEQDLGGSRRWEDCTRWREDLVADCGESVKVKSIHSRRSLSGRLLELFSILA